MDKQNDSVSNFIPRNLLEIICKLESDEVRHSWKLIRNLDSSFSLVIKSPAQKSAPLKCHASGQVPASRQDKISQDSSNDKLTNQREKRSKRKPKSPSVLARGRSRNKAFWKRVKASKKAQAQEARRVLRQEETRTEAIQPENPDLLDSSSVASEGVRDPTYSHLTVEQETAQKELNELSAEAAESEQSTSFLDNSEELAFRKYFGVNRFYEPVGSDSEDDSPNQKYVLLGEKFYVVGRRDCDILVPGDPTVSRKHAQFTVSHPEANLGNVTKLPALLLKDLSKFGTWVNKERVSGEKLLSDGDEITFGSNKSLYTVVYEPFVITSSCLDGASKKLVRQQLCILGGHMTGEWSNDCSLVVMNKISVTIKVICALVSLKSIVLPGYLEQYVKHLQGTSEKPDPTAFTPELAETQLDPSEVSFSPDSRRKTLFQGMKFVFLSQKQLKKLNQAIELAGGMALLMDTPGDDGILVEEGTVVMQCQETDLSPKAEKWVKHVQDLLERTGKHLIQDAEIGYAVLYSSTEKHCNPDYTHDRDLSKLPSQSLTQADMFVANTETQHRTQTQGKVQRNTQFRRSQQQKGSITPAKTPATDPVEQKKSSRHSRSPSPAKPAPEKTKKSTRHTRSPSPAQPSSPIPAKRQKATRGSRSPPPGPQVPVQVKEEPVSQPERAATFKKRHRPVIEDDSSDDEDIQVPHRSKRVKVEPETPRSKTGTVANKKTARESQYALDSDENLDNNEDEFDKIDARMSSRRRKPSPKPQGHRSPSVSPRVSPTRRSEQSQRRSPSRKETVAKTSATIKTESHAERSPCSDLETGTSRGRSDKGQTRSAEGDICESVAGGSRSGQNRVRKTEVEENDYEMSAAVHIQDSEDVKPAVLTGAVPRGFLSTARPIEDQVPVCREFQAEPDQPSNCVKVEFTSLVARKPPAKEREDRDFPDGCSRWRGKVVKNFKKFRKVQPSGQVGLPTVIGGSDLEVYVPHRSKEMDDWFRDTVQAESQHASEERRAQELFDFDPSRRRGR